MVSIAAHLVFLWVLSLAMSAKPQEKPPVEVPEIRQEAPAPEPPAPPDPEQTPAEEKKPIS